MPPISMEQRDTGFNLYVYNEPSLSEILREAQEAVKHEISFDPGVMHGAACVAGTRIPVYLILELLEAGYSLDDILEVYPRLTPGQVRAAIRFAAEVLETEIEALKVFTGETTETEVPFTGIVAEST
jgi:uncharacterized protein (DUF433 family)